MKKAHLAVRHESNCKHNSNHHKLGHLIDFENSCVIYPESHMTKRKIAESLLISQQQHFMDGKFFSLKSISAIVVFSKWTLTFIANFSTIFSVSLYYLDQFISYSVLIWLSIVKSYTKVQLISISRLMMAYGLGRNIALLQTSLYSFNRPLLQLLNGWNRNNSLLTIIVVQSVHIVLSTVHITL